ncbi:hypothetical protein Golob_016522 [Gossypium lobatum]|uniref:Uncharacterized protein n=1 Tax=Gossypium lobatum TaxID=34289 RepID=A0A7J8M4E6_9ROSI|nr:hypothetical protein [Gossypium lobatum]
MASPFINLFFFPFLITHFYTVICDNGWIVAKHDCQTYNNWASTNMCSYRDITCTYLIFTRFSNLCSYFSYKKDSVLVEYDKCQTSHPQFFSNNGDTVYKLDRPGLIYFISWATGYYQRGHEMVEKIVQAIDEFVVNCDPETMYKFAILVQPLVDSNMIDIPQADSIPLQEPATTESCSSSADYIPDPSTYVHPMLTSGKAGIVILMYYKQCDEQWCSL